MLHVFTFPNLISGVTYKLFFKILKSHAPLVHVARKCHGTNNRVVRLCILYIQKQGCLNITQ